MNSSTNNPLTDTNMLVHMVANTEKLVSEDHRYQYNKGTKSELDDDYTNYMSEKPNKNHDDDITDTKNNTDTRNHTDTRNNDTHNNDTNDTHDTNHNKDNKEKLTEEEKMLRKLDMLRKLSELAQAGVKLSQNYNMNSDYNMMKYEYELHKGIRAKQNGINWMSSMSLNLIYGIEMLNDKYNPFNLKLSGWSEQINADINNYYDVYGELYEKYNQPGKSVAPELKLLLMLSGSALKFHLTNTLMGKVPSLNKNIDVDPILAEQLRQKAITTQIKDQTIKNNNNLKQNMMKEHETARQKMYDLNLIKQKELELQNLKKDNAIKNEKLKKIEQELALSKDNQTKDKTPHQNHHNQQPIEIHHNNIPPAVLRMQQLMQQQQIQQQQEHQKQLQELQKQQQHNQYILQQQALNQQKVNNELEKLKMLKIQKEKELKHNSSCSSSSSSSSSKKSSKKSSNTSTSTSTNGSSHIKLKKILSNKKQEDNNSSDKIKNLGTISKDEMSRSNISLGKKKSKNDDTSESELEDKVKVIKQKKITIKK